MQFKAKIKQRTQCSVRGTRLLSTQVLTTDSNKSVHVQGDLSNSSFNKNPPPQPFDYQPEVSRFNNRHTTEIIGEKHTVTRQSYDPINNYRSQRIQSSVENRTDRERMLQLGSQNKILQEIVEDKQTRSSLKRSQLENKLSNTFKDLRIQRITSNQTRLDRSLNENYYQKALEKQFQSQIKENFQQRSKQQINIWENLYSQYKQKYDQLQKDYAGLVTKMKDAEEQIQYLQKDKESLKNQLQNQTSMQAKIGQQEAKILKLEESVRINRNINEVLMKKEKEIEYKLKAFQDQSDKILKQKVNEAKEHSKQEVTKKFQHIIQSNEKQIFQLKLKLIDQANHFQQYFKQNQSSQYTSQSQKNQILQELSNITQERDEILTQLTLRNQQLSQKNNQISQLYQQCNRLSANFYHSNLQFQKLNSQLSQKKLQLSKLQQQFSRLNINNQQLNSQNEKLASQLAGKQLKIQQLHQQSSRLNANVYHLSSQNEKLNSQLTGKRLELFELNQQLNRLKTNNYQSKLQFQKLTSEIIRIDQQNMRLDQQNIRINNEYQSNMMIFDQKVNHLTNQCLSLQNEKLQLCNILNHKDSHLEELIVTNKQYVSQIQSLKTELNKRKEQDILQQARRAERQTQIQRIKEKQHELKVRLQVVNQKLKKIKEESDLVIQQAQTKQKLIESALIAQNQQLKNEKNLVQEENNHLKMLIANSQTEHERSLNETFKQNEDLMSQNLLFKLEMLQQLKRLSEQNKQLNQELSLSEKNNEELAALNSQLSEEKQQLTQELKLQTQKIDKLNEEIESYIKLEKQREDDIKQKQSVIESRQNQLKEVQQQYLELIEGELKKIHSMNDDWQEEAELELTDRFEFNSPKSKSSSFLQEGLSPHQTPKKEALEQSSQPEQDKYQQSVSELNTRIEELTFVNLALQQKVQQLTELEENSNAIIIEKIIAFEKNLEKALFQKKELDIQNHELLHRIEELTLKCINYQSKIEWFENVYPQLEENLFHTQDELLRSHFQIVNLKLMSRLDDQIESESAPGSSEAQAEDNHQAIESKQQPDSGQIEIQQQTTQRKISQQSKDDPLVNQNLKFVTQEQQQIINQQPQIEINIITVLSDDSLEEQQNERLHFAPTFSEDEEEEILQPQQDNIGQVLIQNPDQQLKADQPFMQMNEEALIDPLEEAFGLDKITKQSLEDQEYNLIQKLKIQFRDALISKQEDQQVDILDIKQQLKVTNERIQSSENSIQQKQSNLQDLQELQ